MTVIDNPTYNPNTRCTEEDYKLRDLLNLLDTVYDLYTAQCWDPTTDSYHNHGRPLYVEVENMLIRTGYLRRLENEYPTSTTQ